MLTRHCRIMDCPRTAAPHRTLCYTHKSRRERHGTYGVPPREPDQITVDSVVTARRALPGITLIERRAAGLKFTDLGLPAEEIARILGVTPRTVVRWRTDRRHSCAHAAAGLVLLALACRVMVASGQYWLFLVLATVAFAALRRAITLGQT